MRHFDAWILRDPYSIWHYYSSGRRWQESVRDMIQSRQICSPSIDMDIDSTDKKKVINPLARSISSQPDCVFLQKLPPEIRLMIYGFVFGDEAVHLVQLKGKIRHVRCCRYKSAFETASHRHCCPETLARWRSPTSGPIQWTPIWQPMTGEGSLAGNHSSIYSHTHNDHLWQLFWSRVQSLEGLETLYLNLDLGRFMGNTNTTVLAGGNNRKISLNVTEQWLQPLMAVRGLKDFDLCVTARCDASAKDTLAQQIGAEAVVLRDVLREVMRLPRGHRHGQRSSTSSDVPVSFLRDLSSQFLSCGMETYPKGNVQRPQLLITAA
ncbi:hypothetical protein TSTA_073420 [Talaromyces stipitatus ATCC 10500]|uniref:DUF7730 domain-containing protein n=1 Tax=Talaromyces stipitatus (strain ATCC 10500 / CBS 375.48 / QM 6759 / NRRL 1006) TaxID=441959 RepID=B8LVD4_TALSN|nr:uncharacterized protein TSTA_073420 [Talaromyces stipitatus ATCC 10500]EED23953.1 hypothetical protein TSTA_073420 [Talaromyces stipitatus ATCC 10500]